MMSDPKEILTGQYPGPNRQGDAVFVVVVAIVLFCFFTTHYLFTVGIIHNLLFQHIFIGDISF